MGRAVRTMFDACDWTQLPSDAEIAAYYVDGRCAVDEATVRQHCPNSILVGISSVGTNAGVVLDVEPGNLDAAQAVDWVLMRRAAGVDPTIYVAQWAAGYGWQNVLDAHGARGVPAPHIWVAPWSDASVPEGAVAAQYQYLGNVDVSAVLDFWPGVDARSPSPTPAVVLSSGDG